MIKHAQTDEDGQFYFGHMTDNELQLALDDAYDDLEQAAESESETEWQHSCLAACLTYALEMKRRGMSRKPN